MKFGKKIIVLILINVFLISCSAKRYHNKTPIITIDPPSKCTKLWLKDLEQDKLSSTVIPKCAKKDIVQWDSAAKTSKQLKQNKKITTVWEIDKLFVTALTAVVAGITALFTWLVGIFG